MRPGWTKEKTLQVPDTISSNSFQPWNKIGHQLDSKEDCLVLRAHQLTSVVELPLKVEIQEPTNSGSDFSNADSGTNSSHRNVISEARLDFQLNDYSFMEDA